MQTSIDKVTEFMNAFGQDVAAHPYLPGTMRPEGETQ